MPVAALDFTPALKQSAGIGRFVRGLVGGLSRLTSEFSFLLVTTRDCPPFDPAAHYGPRFQLIRLPFSEHTFLAAWFRLGLPVPLDRLVPGFDLFHGLNFLLPPLSRAAGVVTVHDLNFLVNPRWAPVELGRFLRRAVPASVRRANLVVADSRATAADIVRLLKADPARVRVVYGGVELLSTLPPADGLLDAFGLEPGFILFIGRVEPRKNLPGLIAAYNLLRQKYPDTARPLVIVGAPGWLYDDFLAALAASPFRADIRWLRGLSDAEVAALLGQAGVLVYPSFYEGFGLPVLEAMAAGVPVVTSNRASLPEVAGDAAWLVDPEDPAAMAEAVHAALTDEAARARAIAAGRARAANFTWEAAAETLLEAYREVLRERG